LERRRRSPGDRVITCRRSLPIQSHRALGCRGKPSLAYSRGALLLSAVLGPSIGRAIDNHGGRGVLALSNLVLAAGLVLLGIAQGFHSGFGLGGPRRRHGPGTLRSGFRHPHRALRPRCARTDHRHHLDRRLRQHGGMAALSLSRRAIWLARCVPCLGGAARSDRAALEPAADPARAAAGPRVRDRRRSVAGPARCDGDPRVRLRRDLVCHRRDGRASAAPPRNRRCEHNGGDCRRRPRRTGTGRGPSCRVRRVAHGASFGFRRVSPPCCIRPGRSFWGCSDRVRSPPLRCCMVRAMGC